MSLQQDDVCWTDEKTIKKKQTWGKKTKNSTMVELQSSRAPKPKVCLMAMK